MLNSVKTIAAGLLIGAAALYAGAVHADDGLPRTITDVAIAAVGVPDRRRAVVTDRFGTPRAGRQILPFVPISG